MKLLINLGALNMYGVVQGKTLNEGIYKIVVQFAQGQEFIDYLSVEKSGNGVFTVPGSFTSRVKLKGRDDKFSFVLKAREGARDIVLNFKGNSINDGQSLAGEIIEPSDNSVIGKFKGVKLYESKQDCGNYIIPY